MIIFVCSVAVSVPVLVVTIFSVIDLIAIRVGGGEGGGHLRTPTVTSFGKILPPTLL